MGISCAVTSRINININILHILQFLDQSHKGLITYMYWLCIFVTEDAIYLWPQPPLHF